MGAGRPKFNQLEMVTTFIYIPSLVTDTRTNKPTDRTDYNTVHRSWRAVQHIEHILRPHLCGADLARDFITWIFVADSLACLFISTCS